MNRPPDAPIGEEADYPPSRPDPWHITDEETDALASYNGPAVQAEIAAAAAGEEELPTRGPAETARDRAVQTAHHDDAVSRKHDDNADDGGDVSRPDQRPYVTAQEAEELFKDKIHGIRLVRDFRTGKIAGIATWEPDRWAWRIVNVETPAGIQARQASINLLMDGAAQVIGAAAGQPGKLDQVVAAASEASSPGSITLKLCNGVAQGVAHHCGLGFAAPALGMLVEQTLSPLVNPPDELSRVLQDLQVLDVAVDAATRRLTPAVYDLAIAELGGRFKDSIQGMTQAELDAIEAAIRRRKR